MATLEYRGPAIELKGLTLALGRTIVAGVDVETTVIQRERAPLAGGLAALRFWPAISVLAVGIAAAYGLPRLKTWWSAARSDRLLQRSA